MIFRLTVFCALIFATLGNAWADDILFRFKDQKKPEFEYVVTRSVISKLPLIQYETVLPAEDNKLHVVRGPLVRDLLKLSGASGEVLTAIALDKYEVEIPVTDLMKYDVIAAIEIDGKPLNIRTRGPAWIVYPVSGTPELIGDPVIEARMIWQVSEMVLK